MLSIDTLMRPRDLVTVPLRKIDDEISSIEGTPVHDCTVTDGARLADLRDARRRIAGSNRGCR
jgi:hypothetical protein